MFHRDMAAVHVPEADKSIYSKRRHRQPPHDLAYKQLRRSQLYLRSGMNIYRPGLCFAVNLGLQESFPIND